jgi:hypothetical protein
MSEVANPKNQNELRLEIEKKVKDSSQTKTIKHNRESYEFTVISINRDWLYFNIQNDRTLSAIEEHIKENHLDDEYFSEKNTFNLEQQRTYQNIIKEFVSSEMKRVFRKTEDQRDPIYITPEGIVANGNTRLACWREENLFNLVDCLVFPSDFSGDWDLIREIVDDQDNAPDIKTDYPWHARAKRIVKNLENGKSYDQIAEKMQYNSQAEAKIHHNMLKLAEEFLGKGYEGFSKLSDLNKIGSGAGLQVFQTFAKLRFSASNERLDTKIKEKLSGLCFEYIGTGNQGDFGSLHLAVQHTWSPDIIKRELQLLREASEVPDILGGEESPTDGIDYDSNPFKGTEKDKIKRKKITDDFLDEVVIIKERKSDQAKRNEYKNGLKTLVDKLKNFNRLSISDDMNNEGIDEIFDDMLEAIEEGRKKISELN